MKAVSIFFQKLKLEHIHVISHAFNEVNDTFCIGGGMHNI